MATADHVLYSSLQTHSFHNVFSCGFCLSARQGKSRSRPREICGIARWSRMAAPAAGRRAPGAGPLALLWRQSPAAPRRTTLLHVPFSESVAAAVLALPASGAVAVHASLAWSR
eukprot:COSAG06_NODE_949_length_11356_cov_2.462112_4_plen_114_part_00